MIDREDKNLLKQVYAFAKADNKRLYIVGGYLRDIILGRKRQNPDMDFCMEKKAVDFTRRLSGTLNAGFVVLDKEHGSARMVKRIKDRIYTLDFTDFRAGTLKDDLLLRDFTMNSLALDLGAVFAGKRPALQRRLIDHYGAIRDLESGIIRVLGGKSFSGDPLRILRAFSLSAIFGFKIDKKTLELIKSEKEKLPFVSPERIRDELFKILNTDTAYKQLVFMDKLGILKLIIPEIEIMRGVYQGPYHHLDVLKHCLESVNQAEIAIEGYGRNKDVRDYLNMLISGPRTRKAIIKLGVFLHDIGKPGVLRRKKGKIIFHGHEGAGARIVRSIARRLKLSNDEVDALNKIVFCHLRPGYMADSAVLTPRAKFRYFRDTAQEAVSVLLISLADQRSTRGPLTLKKSRRQHEHMVDSLIKEYFRKQKEEKLPRLVNGYDLMKKLKLKPGPLIGEILSDIEEQQATGKIKTKQQALESAEKMKDKYAQSRRNRKVDKRE